RFYLQLSSPTPIYPLSLHDALPISAMLEPLLPRYYEEGKSYLTIALGCSGGRHRSVYVAERLAAWLREAGQQVILVHRDMEQWESRQKSGLPSGGAHTSEKESP